MICALFFIILQFKGIVDYSPAHLGFPPNDSNFTDAAPAISADGKTIYFTSDRPGGVGSEDIWFSKLDGGQWSKPENFGEPVNTKTADGVVCFSSDELNMYFASLRKPSIGGADLFVCRKIEGKWQKVENLGPQVNTRYLETHPSISPDGKFLFFTSGRPGGFGGSDIWVSKITEDGWSEPINVGPNINSPQDEVFPYMLWDGVTLYFASKRHGKYELYTSEWQDFGFSPCRKVSFTDKEIKDIVSFTVSAAGDYAYLTMGKRRTEFDIYKVTLPEHMKPKRPVVMIEGVVTDKTSENPLPGAKVVIENLKTGEVYASTITDSSGSYKFALPSGFFYGVIIEADGYLFSSTNIDLEDQEFHEVLAEASMMALIKKGEKIILKNIFFDFAKATLRPESRLELDRIVKMMEDYLNLKVEISGHCDDIGSEEYNLKLSKDRATAVKGHLVEYGIHAERIVTKGYGKSQPLVPNIDEESRQLNRRVEFKILEQ